MSKKLRMTGFSRFLLVLFIIVPGAFIASHLITGEDFDIMKIIQTFKKESPTEVVTEESSSEDTKPMTLDEAETVDVDQSVREEMATLKGKVKRMEVELEEKNSRIEQLIKEHELMKQDRDKAVKDYEDIKKQLEDIKSALN